MEQAMSMSMSMGMRATRRERSSLGRLAETLYDISRDGVSRDTVVKDRIGNKEVPFGEYANSHANFYLVKSEFLPADVDVKAAGLSKNYRSKGQPLLFVSRLLYNDVFETIKSLDGVDLDNSGRYLLSNEKKILHFDKTVGIRNDDNPIAKLTKIRFMADPNYASDVEKTLDVVDAIYRNGLFEEDPYVSDLIMGGDTAGIANPEARRPRMRVEMNLQLLIKQEQTLKLSQQQVMSIRLSQTLDATPEELSDELELSEDEIVNAAITRIMASGKGKINRGQAEKIFYSMINKR